MITTKQVVNEVRRLAAEQPDFVYVNPENTDSDDCLYVHNWANEDGLGRIGGCIAGQALMNLGVPAFKLHDEEYTSVGAVLSKVGVTVDRGSDRDDLDWLDNVQAKQDIKIPWGAAVTAADADRNSG